MSVLQTVVEKCMHFDHVSSWHDLPYPPDAHGVSVEACEKYFFKFFGTSEASSGHPTIIICGSTHSSGPAAIAP